MIYTGWGYWVEFGSTDQKWLKYPLWVANWGVISPKMCPPWTVWTLWQYTATGDGHLYGCEALGVDLNYYAGSGDQLRVFCNLAPAPVLTLEQRVANLEREAKLHGWAI